MKFLSTRKKISDVDIGELVLSCDIANKTDVYRTVMNVMRPIVEHDRQVRIKSKSGAILITSDTHPTAINNTGNICYINGGEITTHDNVVSLINKMDPVISIDSPNVSEQYADFSIDEHENYYAGVDPDNLLLAHNSCTIFYPIWHYQFDDLIVIKNNQGTDETRVRHMDYGVVLSAFFWKRFKDQGNITFFDPNEVPELYEAFYKNSDLFEKIYIEYESRKDLRTKIMSAEEVFKGGILKERTDTGRIYLLNIDNVQNQGSFDPEFHTIYQSNLCLTGDTQVDININGDVKRLSLIELSELYSIDENNEITVRSYDIDFKKEVWAPITAAAKTSTTIELIEIEDEFGNIIKCTPQHEIYTKNRGYVMAMNLLETDELCISNESER